MTIPSNIIAHFNKPVAVLGYGVSGKGVAALLRSLGVWFEVYDKEGGERVSSVFSAKEAAQHDLVVYSPGFPQDHQWLEQARQAGCQLMGELDFASLFWPGALVAVTGTNGKTTLTDFLTLALKHHGHRAVAVGNVGYPLSRLFEVGNALNTIAVCEVSSFQAEQVNHFKPHALLWTNIEEDHLDRYPSMVEYFEAKWNLVEQLTRPRLIIGKSVAEMAIHLGKTIPGHAVIIDVKAQRHLAPQGTCFEALPMLENYLVARQYWELEGYDLEKLDQAAKQFSPPKHRMQKIDAFNGVTFWNDSKATNFASTLAGVQKLDKPIHWIGGGKRKGGDIPSFIRTLAPTIEEAFLIGESASEVNELLKSEGVSSNTFQRIEEAVFSAYERMEGKGTIVLSPGFSSQDLFADYGQRGLAFEEAVMSIKQNLFNKAV